MPSDDHPADGSRGTRCVAPPNASPARRVTGRADPHRLRAHLARQRRAYSARCAAVAEATAAGIRLAHLHTPAARIARSLYAQRRRWQALSPTEQQQCRQARRQYLRTLDPAERGWWLERWLPHRRQLQQAMRRVVGGHGHRDDPGMLAGAPVVVHRGLLALPHHQLALPIAVTPPPSARGFGTKRGPGDITAVGGIGRPGVLTHRCNAGTPCDPT
jgi:hypothetical protein